ncbi:MAG: hypothetical protein L3J47_04965, partial [Sulfurovum sp.]|nr:hypothetical protein [Sulfurovum sp.]
MENKLDFLLNANIGIYNKCEVIEVFGFNKEKKEAFNIFTLVVFEKTKQIEIQELLTDKLQVFKGQKNISWGIQRRIVNIDIAKKLHKELLEENKYQIDDPLNIEQLKSMVEQYVPPRESMHKNIQLNNLLKNNFHNGSYILEFFDEDKKDVKFLLDNPTLLNNFSEKVSEILPIKIGTLSDRLGNVIFQFPINSIKIYHNSIVDRTHVEPQFQGFKIEIIPKINNFDIKNLLIRIYEDNETIQRHRLIEVANKTTKIALDDSFGTLLEIIDKKSSLLLYRYKSFIAKYMHSNIRVNEPQKRVFNLNGKTQTIDQYTSGNQGAIKLLNGGKISYDQNAIETIKYDSRGIPDPNTAGGIAIISEGSIYNCINGVILYPYENVHPVNGNIMGNASYFSRAHFYNDKNVLCNNQLILDEVDGIRIKGSTFENQNNATGSLIPPSYGLNSYNSSFMVGNYEPTADDTVQSTFTKHDYGIYATSSGRALTELIS